jgi:hypothetical protein
MVKRKSKLNWVVGAILGIISAIVWVIRRLFGFFKWLFSLVGKQANTAIANDKKPKIESKFSEFEEIESVSGGFVAFEKYLMNSKSTIGIVLGARGSGKSAVGMRLLENVHAKTGRKVEAMGFLPQSLPKWIKCVNKIEEIENNSFVLVDEGGILFSSRQSLSDANKILSELLLVSRHKDLSILFISQNSSNLDVNAIRQADYLLLRRSSLLQKDFERRKIQQVYEGASGLFEKYADRKNEISYIYSDDFRGIVANKLPSFWSESASKSFKNIAPK